MIKRKKRVKRSNRYPEELKRKIAKSYLAGEASYRILAEENGLKNKDVVKEFVKWYRKKHADDLSILPLMSKKKKSPESSTEAELRRKIDQLEKALAQSSLKVEGLETLIDIAEEEVPADVLKEFKKSMKLFTMTSKV